jgi:predicted  nucleic acid-binding Zn-ribbon protein
LSFWERERKSQKNLKDALKKLKNLIQGVSDTDKDLKEEVEKITDVLSPQTPFLSSSTKKGRATNGIAH